MPAIGPFPAKSKTSIWQFFRKKFLAKYKEEPDVYAAYSYDIMKILAKAVEAGKTTGPDIREYLQSMPPHEGATGTTKFDKNGDTNTKSFTRQQVRQGKYVSIGK